MCWNLREVGRHAGTFLRGVLDKVGVQPELVRIGKYKSAGDQLLRSDMSVRPQLHPPTHERSRAMTPRIHRPTTIHASYTWPLTVNGAYHSSWQDGEV